ncbi:hypothetical protein D187_003657 [Cystobacter fuscus DSM 2262]|uniref:DUF4386 domain-containing protein n=1 Tax=Cystobacter fuscus (strain ATCC 25194 / DSM 2262 / NBRC 100088 / M29) TaxID=1242864 RepID=S9P6A6_CYSF2|nr:DUF4386 domain-containing protein [Cystobacter fuscus]EPX58696.1 hypothetical protein D187_003657 [Cystobacter fuscus DSM 2262]
MTLEATHRRTEILVASLFLITAFGSVAGSTLLDSVVDTPDYLITVSSRSASVVSGVLLWLLNDIGIVFIGLLMFPLLRKHDESLALGYVGMRMLECVFLVIGVVCALLLIPLSQEYISSGAADAAHYQTAGLLLKQARYLCLTPMMLFFLGLGGVILASLLWKSRLVPRPVSAVGVVGYAMLLPMAILPLLGVIDTSPSGRGAILAIPVMVFEIILMPIWLLAKGFNPSALEARQATHS